MQSIGPHKNMKLTILLWKLPFFGTAFQKFIFDHSVEILKKRINACHYLGVFFSESCKFAHKSRVKRFFSILLARTKKKMLKNDNNDRILRTTKLEGKDWHLFVFYRNNYHIFIYKAKEIPSEFVCNMLRKKFDSSSLTR